MTDNTFRGNKEIIETDEYGEWDAIEATADVLHEQLTEYELSIPNTITDDKFERRKYLKHVVSLLKSSGTAELKKARKIRLPGPNYDSLDWILVDVYWCYDMTRHQKDLSPFERILVESKWTDSILRLLRIGNNTVMRSIRYRLMEQTSEENEEGYG